MEKRYRVKDSWFRGGVVIIDKRRGLWRLVDRETRTVLDYGYINRSGWGFYLTGSN